MASESSPSSTERALEQGDPLALARTASLEELKRLKAAEKVIELSHHRKKRTSWVAVTTQSLVGLVAVGGFFTNAYQSYVNKQQQQQQRQVDQERWEREFTRATLADKYRAFFETSVLATDPANPDKRLVGYALLQEFVQDRDYNEKATLMLEESLSQELRGDKAQGLDEAHRNAVLAIVTALSQTSDCLALERASRSVERVSQRHAQEGDAEETREVLGIYVRRVVGRATEVCKSPKDFLAVRRPIRDAIMHNPELFGGARGLHASQANVLLAQALLDRCAGEATTPGAVDCPDVLRHYDHLCEGMDEKLKQEEAAACARVHAGLATLESAHPPAAPSGVTAPP